MDHSVWGHVREIRVFGKHTLVPLVWEPQDVRGRLASGATANGFCRSADRLVWEVAGIVDPTP